MNPDSAQPQIIYTKAVHIYFNELSEILYEKHYFSYRESSQQYVRSLISTMEATIHLKMRHKAPSIFSRYGRNLYYITYPRSKQTTWYFFFTRHADNTYVIRYITNNHVSGHLL